MTEQPPFVKIEEYNKGPIIFGSDVSKIPCFRNSWLYGFGVGIFGGLMTFMGTSRPSVATKSGFICFIGTTWCYWFYCRYNLLQEMKSAKLIKEYMKAHNEKADADGMFENPDLPLSRPDLEIVTVGNKQQ